MADEIAKQKAMPGSGYKCAHCDYPVAFTGDNKKCLCYICGTVNIKPAGSPTGSWLPCVLPETFEWDMPAGVKGEDVPTKREDGQLFVDYDALVALPMNARLIYVDSFDKEWSRMDWVTTKANDPAITIKRMRDHIKPRPIIELG
jgi:hypothetical protein